jgi:hypothetical protein
VASMPRAKPDVTGLSSAPRLGSDGLRSDPREPALLKAPPATTSQSGGDRIVRRTYVIDRLRAQESDFAEVGCGLRCYALRRPSDHGGSGAKGGLVRSELNARTPDGLRLLILFAPEVAASRVAASAFQKEVGALNHARSALPPTSSADSRPGSSTRAMRGRLSSTWAQPSVPASI